MPLHKSLLIFLVAIFFLVNPVSLPQAEEGEVINYFQMEPLDDSLFIQIQNEVFIDPVDPKAEIIVDLRDANNQTVTIKGTLYPYLAFSPETRARIITYPFKIDLGEQVHYGSVFSDIIEKINFGKIIDPPSAFQISSGLHYVNPFFQLLGGERFGSAIKEDVGISFGSGTPYSGALETNMVEANFHIIGFKVGAFSHVDAIIDIKKSNNHNNIYVPGGFQLGYVIPFGNFFEFDFLKTTYSINNDDILDYTETDTTETNRSIMVDGSYFNWEFRYPLRLFGSTRAKFYAARYLGELHFGFSGRELSIAGNVFDFRFDAMTTDKHRNRQYVIELFVQQIFESWGFSALALGPSVTISKNVNGNYDFISIFANLRMKVGTSL